MRTCDLTLSRAAMVIVVGLSFVWALALAQDAPPVGPVAPLPKPPPAKAPAARAAPVAPVAPAPAAPVTPAAPAAPATPAAPAAPAVPATAPATAPAPVVVAKDLRTAWENFLHYILIARADLAESHGKAILQANPDPKDLYALAMESKEAGPTLARGRNLENVAPVIDQINKLIDEGARGVRMDPAEIARWIKALGGPLMGYDQAKERLKVSGQYAVPQLIDTLEDPATSATVRERIINLLPALGKEAVRPLNEVLLNTKDATVREVVARTLGRIGYPHAAPYLKELAQRKDILGRTRDAALGALAECAGKAAANKPVAELYYDLATKYYRHDESVNPDSRYDTSNVWYWQNGTGLTFKVVPRAIFNDVYAMRTAQAALAHDAAFAPAVELWLAANLRREAGLPAGAKDPTYPADRPGAKFHILAASAQFQQGVLRRGLADGDIAVIVGAIGALEKTAGTKNLVGVVADAQGGAQPLVQALTYPARVVRCMAAKALAEALPAKAFNGSHLVVPVLAEALRQTGSPIAVLADPEQEHRNKLKDLLRGAGCVVYDADALGKALEQARDAGGVDVLVLASNIASPSLAEAHQQIRSEGVLSRAPIFLAARAADMIEARQLAKNDPLLTVLPEDKQTAEGFAEAMKAAAAGGLPEDQAGEWAVRAARAIELLAMTRNGVYDLDLARASLIATLGDKRDAVRVAAADALAQFDKPDAQRAIVELANAADAPEPVRIAAYAAASKSVRSFGNTLTEKHVQDVIGVVESSGALPLREAAAQLLGALNLPSEKIKSLVINAK